MSLRILVSRRESSTVPSGIPNMPGKMKGKTRFASIERQIVGRVCTCAMTEHATTREAATGGDTA